jgi:hypothetical protein
MNEAKLRNLDIAILWTVVAISLLPLVPYAVKTLFG